MDVATRNRIRAALLVASEQVEAGTAARERLVREGAEAGIDKAELAELARVSRQTIYAILARADSE